MFLRSRFRRTPGFPIPIPSETSSTTGQKNSNRWKQKSGFKSFRNFGSLFRLNSKQEDVEEEAVKPQMHQEPSILRPYNPALPSAAYLGLPAHSDSTTTSTGVSTDACSLTTSSNFLSAADSPSLESLNNASGGADDIYHSPGIEGTEAMDSQFQDSLASSLAYSSSHFSTMSSRTSQDCSNSPTLFLLGGSPSHRTVDRDRTLVAPPNTSQEDPDPFTLYAYYTEQKGDPDTVDQIQKDIHRQFPFHELFCSKNQSG